MNKQEILPLRVAKKALEQYAEVLAMSYSGLSFRDYKEYVSDRLMGAGLCYYLYYAHSIKESYIAADTLFDLGQGCNCPAWANDFDEIRMCLSWRMDVLSQYIEEEEPKKPSISGGLLVAACILLCAIACIIIISLWN
jgi:hypothetical protein